MEIFGEHKKRDDPLKMFTHERSSANTGGNQKVKDNILYCNSWGETLKVQKSALRWDIKRAMKGLCAKLSEMGEECFVVTVNVANGWVGHMGSLRGDEFLDEKSHILYEFLNYCCESEDVMQLSESEDTASTQSADEDKYPENQQEPSPLTIRIGNTFTLANATEEEADNDLIDMMPFRKQALNGDDTESKDEYVTVSGLDGAVPPMSKLLRQENPVKSFSQSKDRKTDMETDEEDNPKKKANTDDQPVHTDKHEQTVKDRDEGSMFTCTICSAKFLHEGTMLQHKKTHTSEAQSGKSCPACGLTGFSSKSLRQHLQISCQCAEKIKTAQLSVDFSDEESEKKTCTTFTCTVCFAKFRHEKTMLQHYKSHFVNSTAGKSCPSCGLEGFSSKSLEQHMASCEEEKSRRKETPAEDD